MPEPYAGGTMAAVSPYVNVTEPPGDRPYGCPCCGYLTLDSRGGYEICSVCYWEDDGQDSHDADVVRGGPNGSLSLTQARRNFHDFGASSEKMRRHVRPPRDDERP